MAELATIARPYAEALFQASACDLEATQSWLASLGAVASNGELIQFAADPRVNSAQVFQVVSGAIGMSLPERGVNFLRAVIENERLAALPEMARQFKLLASGATGVADAVIQSAFPLSEGELGDIKSSLERKLGRKLNPSVELCPELIGGIRVVVGDEVMDTSVRAQLQKMKMALTA